MLWHVNKTGVTQKATLLRKKKAKWITKINKYMTSTLSVYHRESYILDEVIKPDKQKNKYIKNK